MSIFDFADTKKAASDPAAFSSSVPNAAERAKRLKRLDAAVDSIRHKYGSDAIVRGSFLNNANEFKPKAKPKTDPPPESPDG